MAQEKNIRGRNENIRDLKVSIDIHRGCISLRARLAPRLIEGDRL